MLTSADAPRILAVARGLSKTYRMGQVDTPVLRDVSLQIRAGELALLMGPSGSGKTTLLCVLSGMLKPSAGEVELCGIPITSLPERQVGEIRRHSLGFVFQSYNLFPALTALDNVAEVLALKGLSLADARRAAADMLSRVGLAERLKHRPAELSGGERQRVALARAMSGDPALVLGDEPTAALDRRTGMEVVRLLREQTNERRGVLLVTHDVRLAQYADRVIEIEDGRIVGDGDAASYLQAHGGKVP
jgi:putative ABC transport system ATP-binding protein